MPDLLEVANLTAGYGGTVVIDDISFTLPERGALAVLGRNGVGKSTLLATLMGRTTHVAGRIVFDGSAVERWPVHRRNRCGIGYVPQTREVFPSLTAEENLRVAARPGAWTLERVFALLPGLAARRHHRGNQLSGGEQQMLAIGRALMGNPRLVLLDEPLEGLAPIVAEAIRAILAELISGGDLSIVLVEQHARTALAMTHEALVMSRGRIVHRAPSAELLAAPEHLASLIVET